MLILVLDVDDVQNLLLVAMGKLIPLAVNLSDALLHFFDSAELVLVLLTKLIQIVEYSGDVDHVEFVLFHPVDEILHRVTFNGTKLLDWLGFGWHAVNFLLGHIDLSLLLRGLAPM